ncbi:MAG: hypothetical protein WB780_01705 [Candidatus Acidiferrales bacterium]
MTDKRLSDIESLPRIDPSRSSPSSVRVDLRSFALFLPIPHWHVLLSFFLVLTFTSIARCQSQKSSTVNGTVNGTDNGIAVGRPKIFDNRSLQLMLDSLNASLQSAQFFNPTTLSAAFGLLQGTESYDVTRNLSVSASLAPKSAPSPTSIAGSVSIPGGPSGPGTGSLSATIPNPGSGSSSAGSTSASGNSAPTPGPATLPILAPSPGQFGLSANDLLSDQVNLTYQVFNLRMLLERSLTDRLITNELPQPNGRTRLQAVVGFDVTLDPPKEAKDSAAIVEITITPEAVGPGPKLSLVAVMPQEKTYNSAALNTHDNAFGGSAVAKIITVGYTERHRGQVFYLFRDNDTLAFERMQNAPDNDPSVKFGWQFRPVLGRRSVTPGTRQMFAIIALPQTDEPNDVTPVRINIHVETYWKHYDHRSLTTTYHEAWVHYINPTGIASVPLRLPGHSPADYHHVELLTSSRIQDNLSPVVTKVEWLPANKLTGTVVVHGKNFFSGTTVSLAGQQYTSPSDGLVLQSDQTMIISTTVQAIATGDGVVNGRYGKAVLLGPAAAPGIQPMYVDNFELRPFGSEYSELTLRLKRNGVTLSSADAPAPNALFVSYNDAVLDVPTKVKQDDIDQQALDVVAQIPNSVLGTGDGVVTVKFPFGGKSWEAKRQIYQPLLPVVTRTGGKDKATLAIAYPRPYGVDFRGNWRIILDKSYQVGDPGDRDTDADVSVKRATACSIVEPSCHIVILTAKTTLLDTYQKFVIVTNDGDFVSVGIPPSNPVTQSAQLSKINTISMLQNEARAVVFYGQGLTAIKRVFFNNQDLPFFAKGDGTSITVFISPDVTSKPGHKDIVFQVDQNTLLAGGIDVLPAAGANSPGTGNANPDRTNTNPNN